MYGTAIVYSENEFGQLDGKVANGIGHYIGILPNCRHY